MMNSRRTTLRRPRGTALTLVTLAVALAPLLAGGRALAQEGSSPSPLSDFVVAGYGTVGYTSVPDRDLEDEFQHDFSAAISPVLLFGLGDDFLFESELEIELEGGGAAVGLEYAQIDFLGFENVQITAGKFLLPFGLFSERLHPTWINKMPSMPLLYGHGHGGVAEGALFPVLADIGAVGRWAQPLGDRVTLDVSVWITQGPRALAEEEGEAGGEDHAHSVLPLSRSSVPGPAFNGTAGGGATDLPGVPDVAFGTNTSDNNDNKMLGARAGVVVGGDFEVYLSGFHAMYNDEDFLDIYSGNVAAEWRPGRFEVRGEGAILWREVILEEEAAYETLKSPGYYVQASRRIGSFEPVLRWSHLPEAEVGSRVAREELRQVAVGLDYWLSPSIPVKVAYEWNLDADERVLVQWAYGF